MNTDHYRKLVNMYYTAPLNEYYLPEMKIEEGRAELTIDVRSDFFHAAGAVHGSVYFKMLDDAAFFAANSVVEEVFVYTVSFTTYMTRPISEGIIRAEGKVVSATKNLIIAESVAYNKDGKQIGRGNGTFMKSGIKLDESIGYGEIDPAKTYNKRK